MGNRHRWKRWTPERIAAVEAGVAAGKSRDELLAEIRALPGHEGYDVECHHLTGYVRHHFGRGGLARMAPRKRRAPEVLERPLEPMPWYATAVEIAAYAREVGMTGQVTLARVNEARAKQGRDPFVLVRDAA